MPSQVRILHPAPFLSNIEIILMNKRNAFIATVTGGVFLASFLLFTSLAEDLFLKWFPSEYEDDVRFDLFLPGFGSAYLISSLASLLIGLIVSKLIGKKFSTKMHVRFVLIGPLLFLVAYLIFVAILLLFYAVGFHNERLDGFLVYFIGFAVMIAGYYRLLNKAWRAR